MLDKAIRELDQMRVKLEQQEKTLASQIKQSAQKGQMGAAKIQAKDLVRTRRYIEKFYGMRSQLQKISLRLQVRRGRVVSRPGSGWMEYGILTCRVGRHTGRTNR